MTDWSTERFAPDARFDAWRGALNDTHLPWAISPTRPQPFAAGLQALDTEMLKIVQCHCDPCTGSRDPRTIRGGDDGVYGVLMVRSGRERVTQGDVAVEMGPGSTLIWDASLPIRFDVLEPLEKCTFFVAKDQLTTLTGQSHLPTGPLDSSRGFAALLHERATGLAAG